MRFASTSGRADPASLAQAIGAGLAPDGGLFVPERIPSLPESFWGSLRSPDSDLHAIAHEMARPFVDDALPEHELRRILEETLDFPIPLVPLEDDIAVLELFHGPTLAFKDVGARFLARMLPALLPRSDRPLTVLVATSGDTGSAVADAFHCVEGTRVLVLFPEGRVSELQRRQFTSLGGNVRALAVPGAFDDCQRLVKAAFADAELGERVRLTSANSINIGRLLPQAFYYAHALAQAARRAPGSPPPLFCTPSGNFGNLTAGLLALRMGMPVEGFVAATNVNDAVPRYLETGEFTPRASVATLSNAMDVGDPSNFARILHLYGGDRSAISRDVRGASFDDHATRRCIGDVHRRLGRVLDPHTAVGYLGLRAELDRSPSRLSGVLLATAHPAKFPEAVGPLVGGPVPPPERLARRLDEPERVESLADEEASLRDLLLGG